MGEIMDESYNAAWRQASAAAQGKQDAISVLQPQIDALKKEIEALKLQLAYQGNRIDDIDSL